MSFGAFGITSLDATDAIKSIRTMDIMQRGKICIVRERTYQLKTVRRLCPFRM